MEKTLPVGIDNFKDLIENDFYYIDKTAVIEEILKKQKMGVILFPRPKRFGKSLVISMLENFFDIDKKEENKDLFNNLYISKMPLYQENLNEYPVISLDFKDLKDNNYDSVIHNFKSMMSEAYGKKEHILNSLKDLEVEKFNRILNEKASLDEYKESLVNLSKWCERHYSKKTIILIDEYDVPMDVGNIYGFYDKVMELIRPLFSKALKGNDSLQMGVLTGVLRIGGESLFSDFNNPNIYDVMTPGYNEYFGFTEEETKKILEDYGLELTSEVKKFYDGYNFNGVHIYNPWSIINYAEKKQLTSYWVNTGSNILIKKLLKNIRPEEKMKIDKLILGESIAFEYVPKLSYNDLRDSTNFNSVLNLLLVSGYLTYEGEKNEIPYYRIPNIEVRNDLANILQLIDYDEPINYRDDCIAFRDALLENNKEKAEINLNKILQTISYNDSKEVGYHGYMLCLFTLFLNNQRYIVSSNEESGYGRPDMLIRKKDMTIGLVIEFKVADSIDDEIMEKKAKEGINQLKEKNYKQRLEFEDFKEIYEYVLVFHGKKAIVR